MYLQYGETWAEMDGNFDHMALWKYHVETWCFMTSCDNFDLGLLYAYYNYIKTRTKTNGSCLHSHTFSILYHTCDPSVSFMD
ncbi:hypothetical protein Patl1_01459 [Pistacia atlantica]|uniref:Uncharacterized protein n=1 Tax=Pistacia atlantica TaxID=434234 RepID=A0ACC1C764_9ROSI|nr:hypothetical protein Patl1_01459 [Pistacia atlantica]